MITNFPLPSFIDKNTNKSEIYAVKQHLEMLAQQENALAVLNLFNDSDFSDLKSFAFTTDYESNDEGGTYAYFSPRRVLSHSGDSEKEEELHDMLSDFLNDLDEEFIHALSGNNISSDNIEQQVAQAMGEAKFKLWQDNINIVAEKEHLEATIQTDNEHEAKLKL
jgi:hypothetical protein